MIAALIAASLTLTTRPIDPPLDPGDTWFYKVNVVPMDTERILPVYTVHVKNGEIVEMAPSQQLTPPAGSREIDGKTDMYLVPGFCDMHFHLYFKGDLLSLLDNGVTTMRNMRGRQSDLDFRRQIRDGDIPGPTIFTAGPILGGPNDGFVNIQTPEQGIKTVDEQHSQGYDFIKVYDGIPKDAYFAVLKEAHRLGMKVAGHIPDALRVIGALNAHQDSLEHAEQFVYDYFDTSMNVEQIPSLTKKVKASGCYVCPTMGLIHNFIELVDDRQKLMSRPEIRFANPETIDYWKTVTKTSAGGNRLIAWFQAKLIKSFADADVPLLSGTDTHIIGFVPGFSLHREFHWMADAGLSPYQVLQSTTSTPGIYLQRKTGRVAVGYQADLVLLHKNPLESVDNLADREGVMIRGKWHGQSELDGLMEDLVKSYSK
jgi:imidazolonepropionase-like amidohydrolase